MEVKEERKAEMQLRYSLPRTHTIPRPGLVVMLQELEQVLHEAQALAAQV